MTDLPKFAYHYTARLGFGLVPIPHGLKRPVTDDWQNCPVTDPLTARNVWSSPQNMGLLHDVSRTCTVDVDHLEYLKLAAAALKVDLLGMIEAAPLKIRGKNGDKPLFRLPEGVELPYGKVAWPHQTERLENGRPRSVTVIEFRAGHGRQDILPPSIHPDTGRPYEWVGQPPRCYDDIPVMPPELVAFWQELGTHIETMRRACPWDAQRPPEPPRGTRMAPYTGESVIAAYNARCSPAEVLERNGYKRRGSRYVSPHSGTKMAGVTLYLDGEKVRAVSYHGSDDWADQKGHDAFDLFMTLEHGGRMTEALEAARQELGMGRAAEKATDARILWQQHGSAVLGQIGSALEQMPLHHHAREAAFEVIAHIFGEADAGHLEQRGGHWCVMVGGLKGLKAAGLGGTLNDISARLKWAGDLGYLGTVSRTDPEDRYSPLAIRVPADPRDLPGLSLPREYLQAVTRPATGYRKSRKPTQTEEAATLSTVPSKATPVDRVENLTRCLRVVLARDLGHHPELPGWAERHLTRAGLSVTTSYRELRAEISQRREADQAARLRYVDALNETADFARRSLILARFVPAMRRLIPQRRALLERTTLRLERLRDGEPVYAVNGKAA